MHTQAPPPEEYDPQQFAPDLEVILTKVRAYHPSFDEEDERTISRAFWFAEQAHRGQKRFSGEPYFIHPIAATKILLEINPDIESIAACLMHDVPEDTTHDEADIERAFGKNISTLCAGVGKVSRVQLRGADHHYENLRKLFIAMAQDMRVILIKLAERIHNLQTLEYVAAHKRQRIATESLNVYAPVAEKLSLFTFKGMIEDLCFKHLHPSVYNALCQDIAASTREREAILEASVQEIERLLKADGIPSVQVRGRTKNIYSLYEKMKRKHASSVSEIYDLQAIRVLTQTAHECYRALGVIHAHWKPIPGRFKDYIAVPKPNGYQSLHTTILGLCGSKNPTEIQIKTMQMHVDAEYGPASHWAYKQAKSSSFDEDYVRTIGWFPEDIKLEVSAQPEIFFEHLSEFVRRGRIHVFTPRGEIKNLPDGSTPVDFAYAIHTEIGHSCIGAKVNGIIKPLDYPLQNGEVVEIITKKGRTPNPAWISFVGSPHARSQINAFVNRQQKNTPDAPKLKVELVEEPTKAPTSSRKGMTKPSGEPTPDSTRPYDVIIGGEEGLTYRIATCCEPVPGDPIIAYASRGHTEGYIVHHAECHELARLDAERFMEAHFILQRRIRILAHDRKSLMRDYSDTISRHGIFIWDIHFHRREGNIADWVFTLNVPSDREMRELIQELREVPNVQSIEEL